MKQVILLILVCASLTLSGCAAPSQVLINEHGNTVRCACSGYGILGVATALASTNSCIEDYKKMGYWPIGEKHDMLTAKTVESKAVIDKLMDEGFENPIFSAQTKAYYLISTGNKERSSENISFLLATVYEHEKLFKRPNDSKFFSPYAISDYIVNQHTATRIRMEYFSSNGTSVYLYDKETDMPVKPTSPIDRQLKYLSNRSK